MDPIQEFDKSVNRALDGVNHAVDQLASTGSKVIESGSAMLTQFLPKSAREGQTPAWGHLATEISESDMYLLVEAEMPGVDKEDCDIRVEGEELVIRGEKRPDADTLRNTHHSSDRAYGYFEKRIALPYKVDDASAAASLRNGVLKVQMQRPLFVSSGRIDVQ